MGRHPACWRPPLLVRIVDPEFETSAAGCIAAASVLGYLFAIPTITFGPAMAFNMSPWAMLGFWAGLFLVAVLVVRIFCWKKRGKGNKTAEGVS